MDFLLSLDGTLASLALLAGAAFLAATLIPFSSEAVLFAVLRLHPDLVGLALITATAANTAGGMTTYALGRWFGDRKPAPERARAQVGRWGAPATALAWLPLVGDGLSLAAGWLRLGLLPVLAWQALGRLARYWVVAQGSLL